MVCCREIGPDDIAAVVDLLAGGFTEDPRYPNHVSRARYWSNALRRLESHPVPAGLPRYGYCLDTGRILVGVVLLIFVEVGGIRRCNVSSWYVDPAYRIYAAMLAQRATKHKDMVFFNTTPAPNTWEILERQGFASYAHGRFIAVPFLSRTRSRAWTIAYSADVLTGADLCQSEVDMLRDHAAMDCLSLICSDGTTRYPFIFDVRIRGRALPMVRLIYCRGMDSFVRFAGVLGRYLLRRGYLFVVTDAEGPVPGLIGRYKLGAKRYWKGPIPMHLGDMVYSEIVMFDYTKVRRHEREDNPAVSRPAPAMAVLASEVR